jgi:hypothetical protein
MKSIDIVISPVGVEDPLIHIVSINGVHFNIAIQLKAVVLLGECTDKFEYRGINLDVEAVFDRLDSNTSVIETIRRAICSEDGDILSDGGSIKNVAYRGVEFCIIYYLILKYRPLNEETTIRDCIIKVIDGLLKKKAVHINESDARGLVTQILNIQRTSHEMESRVIPITRNQIGDTQDLSQPIWKELYIAHVLRGIGSNAMLLPLVDWAIIRGVNRHLFTDRSVVSDVETGESIEYIRSTVSKQLEIAKGLSLHDVCGDIIKVSKSITDRDYLLGDIAFTTFNIRKRSTIKELLKECSHDIQSFKQLIFQYLHSVSTLARHGIIHNNPSLNNIVHIGHRNPIDTKYYLSDGRVVNIDPPSYQLALTDYSNSILSKEHGNQFDQCRSAIIDELCTAFRCTKDELPKHDSHIFSCYVLYDVVRFCLSVMCMLDTSADSKSHAFIRQMVTTSSKTILDMIKQPDSCRFRIDDPHGGIEWVISLIYESDINGTETPRISLPQFISSGRKRAIVSKYEYISQYASRRILL